MDAQAILPAPAATAFEAIGALVSALVYAAVALAALMHASRDARVRVFAVTSFATAVSYAAPALSWYRGTSSAAVAPAIGVAVLLGGPTLFHFTQLFPWRRPWIRAHGLWLWVGYAAAIVVGVVAAFLSAVFDAGGGGIGAVSGGGAEILLIAGVALFVPAVIVLGVVVPLAAVLSLYRSWAAARRAGIENARITTFWILVSQMAGGLLAILVMPLLRGVASGPWITAASAVLLAFGLMLPLAFAIGVWKYRVLDLPIEALPQ